MADIPITSDQGDISVSLGQIQFGRSITPGAVPSAGTLQEGAIEINLADKKIFTKDHNGTVISLGKDYSADIAAAEANAVATSNAYTDGQVTALKGGADTSNDTLAKLAGRIDQVASDVSTGIGSLTKADVGLENVENYTISDSVTDDISTQYASSKAVKTAFDRAVTAETTAQAYADQIKSDLLGGAPAAALDTIFELSEAITNNADAVTAINNAIALKADTTYVDAELAKKLDATLLSDSFDTSDAGYSAGNIASSAAVTGLRALLEQALADGLALKVNISDISDAIDSDSSTTVASSKAVKDSLAAGVAHTNSVITQFGASLNYGRTF